MRRIFYFGEVASSGDFCVFPMARKPLILHEIFNVNDIEPRRAFKSGPIGEKISLPPGPCWRGSPLSRARAASEFGLDNEELATFGVDWRVY
jgi:hypothetical protein